MPRENSVSTAGKDFVAEILAEKMTLVYRYKLGTGYMIMETFFFFFLIAVSESICRQSGGIPLCLQATGNMIL